MKWVVPLCLALALQAAPALHVAAVVRTGMPPYEASDRLYRLEGADAATLRTGEVLTLSREGERRSLGRLKVVSVKPDHALARLTSPGETFPLKGDEALRAEDIRPLPRLAAASPPVAAPAPKALAPKAEKPKPVPPPSASAPAVAPPVTLAPIPSVLQREPIYFLKANAALSPGAFAKLKQWVETWGRERHWILECPGDPGTILIQERIQALSAELRRLGAARVDIARGSEWPTGPYDAVFVRVESW